MELPHNHSPREVPRMKLHRNAKTTPMSRLLLVRRVLFEGWDYATAAEAAGVSARTVMKWWVGFAPRAGPAQLTARVLTTPVGEVTGAWHYHPGYVYNVVTQGTVTIEDGCGGIHQYSKGEAFETSEGRVHRAYNLGTEDAMEHNMFVGPPGRPITVNIPNNEQRCGPPSTAAECLNG